MTNEEKLIEVLERISNNAHRIDRAGNGALDDIIAPVFLNDARALLNEIKNSKQAFNVGLKSGETCYAASLYSNLVPIFDNRNHKNGELFCFAISRFEADKVVEILNKNSEQ